MMSKQRLLQFARQRNMILETFEKPVQIYRFYSIRWHRAPIFLQRNLSYMARGSSRPGRPRSSFKVDQIYERTLPKNAILTGVTDGQIWLPETQAKVDVMFVHVFTDTGRVNQILKKSIDSKIYSPEVRSSPLEISVPPLTGDPIVIGQIPTTKDSNLKAKNLKPELVMVVRVTLEGIWLIPSGKAGDLLANTRSKRRRILPKDDLVVYVGTVSLAKPNEKLIDADFDVILKRVSRTRGSGIDKRILLRESSWEFIDQKEAKFKDHLYFVASSPGKYAKVSIAIRGSTSEMPIRIEEPASFQSGRDQEPEPQLPVWLFYRYVYGADRSRLLEGESRTDLTCPWCFLKCQRLSSLLKHFELCHTRFQFSFSRKAKSKERVKIEVIVAINDNFDNAEEKSFMVRGQKTTDAKILREYFGEEDEDMNIKPVGYLNDRVYYHSTTGLPILPFELDVASDGEPDSEEVVKKTECWMDEFTDLNEGEKEFMKLWNRFLMKNKFRILGDSHIPLACKEFIELHGREVWEKSLYRNFCLHFCNLVQFGLLTPIEMDEAVQQIQSLKKEVEVNDVLSTIVTCSQENREGIRINGQ